VRPLVAFLCDESTAVSKLVPSFKQSNIVGVLHIGASDTFKNFVAQANIPLAITSTATAASVSLNNDGQFSWRLTDNLALRTVLFNKVMEDMAVSLGRNLKVAVLEGQVTTEADAVREVANVRVNGTNGSGGTLLDTTFMTASSGTCKTSTL